MAAAKVRLSEVVRANVAPSDAETFFLSSPSDIEKRWPEVWAKIENEAKRRDCSTSQMFDCACAALNYRAPTFLPVEGTDREACDELGAMAAALGIADPGHRPAKKRGGKK